VTGILTQVHDNKLEQASNQTPKKETWFVYIGRDEWSWQRSVLSDCFFPSFSGRIAWNHLYNNWELKPSEARFQLVKPYFEFAHQWWATWTKSHPLPKSWIYQYQTLPYRVDFYSVGAIHRTKPSRDSHTDKSEHVHNQSCFDRIMIPICPPQWSDMNSLRMANSRNCQINCCLLPKSKPMHADLSQHYRQRFHGTVAKMITTARRLFCFQIQCWMFNLIALDLKMMRWDSGSRQKDWRTFIHRWQ